MITLGGAGFFFLGLGIAAVFGFIPVEAFGGAIIFSLLFCLLLCLLLFLLGLGLAVCFDLGFFSFGYALVFKPYFAFVLAFGFC